MQLPGPAGQLHKGFPLLREAWAKPHKPHYFASMNTARLNKHWIYRDTKTAPPEIASWAAALGVSEWLALFLWERGLPDAASMNDYLTPGLKGLVPPKNWPGVDEAAICLAEAARKGKKIVVWGDYDVDGITATALCLEVFSWHGVIAHSHIPSRTSQGYGLNLVTLETLAAQGMEVLLTVDCGINDVDVVARANELGITVIITDHHLPGDTLPAARAVCNPRLPGAPYPHLAGVGMVFYLMAEVNNILSETAGKNSARPDIRRVLDLVALGTVADMVDLNGQNRILVKNGLLVLAQGKRTGLAALKAYCGYSPSAPLDTGQVAFALAPRLNAAGRLDRANEALDLMLCRDAARAAGLAESLNVMNTERRAEEERASEEALTQARAACAAPAFVLFAPHWHPGIVGIVASRVVEVHHKPCLVICEQDGVLKGSGRSISAFNLHEGLTACADLFLRFGGHHQAAGFSLLPGNLEKLRARFLQITAAALGEEPVLPRLFLDGYLNFKDAARLDLVKELQLLQPFGMHNPEPVFASPPLLLKSVRPFGGKHATLELTDEDTGITLRAKAWRSLAHFPPSRVGQKLQIAYSPRLDAYNGLTTIDLQLRDWKWL